MLVTFSCSDKSTGSDDFNATYSDIYSNVISTRCATSGCHVSSHPYLDLSNKELAYTKLINKKNHSNTFDYIEPNEPDNSYLYLKIIGDPGAGARMPKNGPPYLTEDEISTIREWIESGALNN